MMTRGRAAREGNYASLKESRSQRLPAANQGLTFLSLQTSNRVGEGGELPNNLPSADEAAILPSQSSNLQEGGKARRKGSRSIAPKQNVKRLSKTKTANPPARSGLVSIAPKGPKCEQHKRSDRYEAPAETAPSIPPYSSSTGSACCDKPSKGSAESQTSKSHLGLHSLHPGPATTVCSKVQNFDLMPIQRPERSDTQRYPSCSSEPAPPPQIPLMHEGSHTSDPLTQAEAQSRAVSVRYESRSWARHLPTNVVEASPPRISRLSTVPSPAEHPDLLQGNNCSTHLAHQKKGNAKESTLMTVVVEPIGARLEPKETASCYLKATGHDRLVVGTEPPSHQKVQSPRHLLSGATENNNTSEDYDEVKRDLVASENTYKRLSAAYQELRQINTIAHQRVSIAESELKRLKKQLSGVHKDNTEHKASYNSPKRQAKQKSHQAVVRAQHQSPIALGQHVEFDGVHVDVQSPEVPTTKTPPGVDHCERPIQNPLVEGWNGSPLSAVATSEPCTRGTDWVGMFTGQEDLNDFGQLGMGLDGLEWGEIDPLEFQKACNSMLEDEP